MGEVAGRQAFPTNGRVTNEIPLHLSEYKASKAVQKDATGRAHSVPTAGRGGTPWACAQLAAGGSTHADLATRAREPPRAQGPRKQKTHKENRDTKEGNKHQSEQKGGEEARE